MTSGLISKKRLEREAQLGIWPNRILTEYLDRYCREKPDAPAIIAVNSTSRQTTIVTYRDLHERAARIACGLTNLGVTKGEVVSFQLPNWWEFVAVHLACLRIGAISNPLMPIFRHRELSFMLENAGSRVFIAPENFRGFDHGALARQLCQEIQTLEHVILVDGSRGCSFEAQLLSEEPEDRFSVGCVLDPNDIVQLLYTSGTTGKPKGVMHTSNTLIGTTQVFMERMQLGVGEVVFMPSPFAHQAGFTYGMIVAMLCGAPLLTLDIWEPELAAELIETYGATYTFSATPFLADLAGLAGIEQRNLSAFRLFVTSGAPIPPPLVAAARTKIKAAIVSGWGMTECGIVTTTMLDDAKVLTSDGVALPGEETRIVDNAGKTLPPGEEGRLLMRGAALFVGYFKQPDLYDVDEDGWFDTGDIGRMDEDGYLRICGREKDIVIRGGENIPVVEIENVIYEMPEVADAAIVAMPDPRLVERACLFATAKPGKHLTLEDVTGFLDCKNVAKQFWPERIEVIEDMPRTPSGKIQKFILREVAKNFTSAT
ncbi:MAG: AMP-binding protein [Fimbriimonadaceae bacterium]|nr:AMP-binding protein [Alphaproteobacteria bacterium]